jgi:DNA anti-recombination protein RmuC
MRTLLVLAVASLSLAACAEPPPPVSPAAAEVARARYVVWQRDQRIAALEEQNRALAADLRARDAARQKQADDERADLVRRVDDLARANADLAVAVSDMKRAADARAGVRASAPMQPVETSNDEIRRLREQLERAGFGGVTLNAAQVRALLRSIRPTRPIDETSPFAL